mgnify:CR=1 FL=1
MLKVYITDLAAFNSGVLVGKWITLPLTDQELNTVISEVLSEGETAVDGENHEEWFITDYEWEDIDLFSIDEYENIFELSNKLEALQYLTDENLKAVKFILDEQFTYDIEDAILRADDVTIHEDQCLVDIAYDLMEESYGIDKLPSIISSNIDYEGIASELDMSGTYWEIDNDVYEYIG